MAINFQQTDTAATAAQACSAATATGATARQASDGGTPGSSSIGSGNQNSATVFSKVMFDLQVPAGATWGAGDYVVRLNVTTGNANIRISSVYVCRINSSGVSQATIGSLTGIATSLSAGVKTFTVSGSAQTPAAGDRVYVVLVIENVSGSMNQSMSWTPNQLIDTPITAAAAPQTVNTGKAAITAAALAVTPAPGAISVSAGKASITAAALATDPELGGVAPLFKYLPGDGGLTTVRHSRASYRKSDNSLGWATHNWLLHSDDMTQAAWGNLNMASPLTGQSDPWGSTLAQKLRPDAVSGTHRYSQQFAGPSVNSIAIVSFIVKAGEYDFMQMTFTTRAGTNQTNVFQISTQTWFLNANSTNSFAIDLGDGWWWTGFCINDVGTGVNPFVRIGPAPAYSGSGAVPAFSGNSSDGAYFAGAMCETVPRVISTPGDYVRSGATAGSGIRDSHYVNGQRTLLVEPPSTNVLNNSMAPATQTLSLAADNYLLWVEGSGSVTLSGGPTGTATEGSPVEFTLGVTTDVTFTVSGTVTLFQCEMSVGTTAPLSSFIETPIVGTWGREEEFVSADFDEVGPISILTDFYEPVRGAFDFNPAAVLTMTGAVALATPRFQLQYTDASNEWSASNYNPAGNRHSALTNPAVEGDEVELAGRLYSDGSVDAILAVNGGSGTTGSQSTSGTNPSSFGGKLWIGSDVGVLPMKLALRGLVILSGIQSLATLREELGLAAGAQNVNTGKASLTSTARSVTPSVGAVTVNLGKAALASAARSTILVRGALTVSAGKSSLTSASRSTSLVRGTVTTSTGRSSLTSVGRSVTLVRGAITAATGRGTLTSTARGPTTQLLYTLSLAKTSLTGVSRAPTLVLGAVSAATGRSQITSVARSISSALGAATVTIGRGNLTAAARSVVPSNGAINTTTGRTNLTSLARAATTVIGAVAVSLGRGALTSVSRAVTLVRGAATAITGRASLIAAARAATTQLIYNLTGGRANINALPLSVTPVFGAISTSTGRGELVSTSLGISSVAGAVNAATGTANVSAEALEVINIPGAVIVEVGQSGVTASARSVSSGSFVSIDVGRGILTASALGPEVEAGAVAVAAGRAVLTSAALAASVEPGAVSTTIGVAPVAAAARDVSATSGGAGIALGGATLSANALGTTLVPGQVDIGLGTSNVTTAARSVSAVNGAISVALEKTGVTAAAREIDLEQSTPPVTLGTATITTIVWPVQIEVEDTIIDTGAVSLTAAARSVIVFIGDIGDIYQPPCPVGVSLVPSVTGVMLAESVTGVFIESSVTGVNISVSVGGVLIPCP